MSIKLLAAVTAFLLSGCIHTETPYECMAVVDLPVRSEAIINKNITINAPPDMIVIYRGSVLVGYPHSYPYRYYGY